MRCLHFINTQDQTSMINLNVADLQPSTPPPPPMQKTAENMQKTLSENIRYLMYKYNILIDDWHIPLSYLVRKVYLYDDFLSISIISV